MSPDEQQRNSVATLAVPLHWTYSDCRSEDDLEQGDFLVLTPPLRVVLGEVHPHFCDDKYLGFAVTTQTCDLVRRKGSPPNAKYISVASVRSLKQVLPGLLSQVEHPIARGVFKNSAFTSGRRFLKRVFDQNEQALGLFYYHPDDALGISEAAVAFLRVTVSLRFQHYEVLVAARRAHLRAEFQAKFGWLVGNLYSRAASRDWADDPIGKKQLSTMLSTNLEEQIEGLGPIWVDDDQADNAIKAGVEIDKLTREDLYRVLKEHRATPRISRVVDEVIKEAENLFPDNEAALGLLRKRLVNNGALVALVKK